MPRKYTPQERINAFWNKVAITNNPDDCWEWEAGLFENGYGAFSRNGKTSRAHRYIWEITYGEIPKGLCVCHRCDVRRCCNPSHLFLATSVENTQDKVNKGRQARNKGLKSGKSAKLTPEQVGQIRQRYAAKELNQYQLAAEYGVRQQQISRIVNYIRWS